MKNLFILFLLVSSFSFSQKQTLYNLPVDSVSGELIYKEKVDIDSVNKSELYKRAKLWFVIAFKDAQEVIQLDDSTAGHIVGKGAAKVYVQMSGGGTTTTQEMTITYMVSVYVKDKKYKYEITNVKIGDTPLETLNEWDEETSKKLAKQTGKDYGVNFSDKQLNEMAKDSKDNKYNMVAAADKGIRNLIFSLLEGMEAPSTGDDGDW